MFSVFTITTRDRISDKLVSASLAENKEMQELHLRFSWEESGEATRVHAHNFQEAMTTSHMWGGAWLPEEDVLVFKKGEFTAERLNRAVRLYMGGVICLDFCHIYAERQGDYKYGQRFL